MEITLSDVIERRKESARHDYGEYAVSLIDKLTKYHLGDVNVEWKDKHLQRIAERGDFFENVKIDTLHGIKQQCHANTEYQYRLGKGKYKIVTGFAYSIDFWHRHSWLVDKNISMILETTHPREAYFGFVLTPEESKRFMKDIQE